MLLLLEGPDQAGKTTLAHRLAGGIAQMGQSVEVRHWGPIQAHPLIEYELPLQDYVPGSGHHVICDRLHIGEAVYGPLYRGESRLDPISWFHIDAFLNSRGAVLVRLWEDVSVLKARHSAEGEDFLRFDDIDRVSVAYETAVKVSSLQRKMRVRATDRLDLRAQILRAGEIEESFALHAYRLTEGRYIGPTLPAVLLVGEKRNLDERGFTSPFVPMPDTSGHYLLKSLIGGSVDPRDVGFINALEDEANLGELWTHLEKPPIVALGGVAHRVLDNLGLPHGAVPHPQWVRRFAHSRGGDYAKLIKQAWQHGGVHQLR